MKNKTLIQSIENKMQNEVLERLKNELHNINEDIMECTHESSMILLKRTRDEIVRDFKKFLDGDSNPYSDEDSNNE